MNVKVKLMSLIALASLFDEIQREIANRMSGVSNQEDNLRQALIEDAQDHGATIEDAQAQIDFWMSQGLSLEDIARRTAIEDAVFGEPSITLENPSAWDVKMGQADLEDGIADGEGVVEGELVV